MGGPRYDLPNALRGARGAGARAPRVAAFTVPAPRRERDLTACQDAAGADVTGRYAVVCVADGVGSARCSATGARVAVEEFVRAFAERPVPDPSAALVTAAAARVAWAARLTGADGLADGPADAGGLHAYATTLAFAVTGAGWALLGAVGDCFGVVMRGSDPPVFELVPDQGRRGGYANETGTLASPDWADLLAERLCVVRDPELGGVLLSTDGLEAVAIRHGRRRSGTGAGEVVQVGVQTGVVDRLLVAVRDMGATGADLAGAVAGNAELMRSKGDDIGVAIATW